MCIHFSVSTVYGVGFQCLTPAAAVFGSPERGGRTCSFIEKLNAPKPIQIIFWSLKNTVAHTACIICIDGIEHKLKCSGIAAQLVVYHRKLIKIVKLRAKPGSYQYPHLFWRLTATTASSEAWCAYISVSLLLMVFLLLMFLVPDTCSCSILLTERRRQDV